MSVNEQNLHSCNRWHITTTTTEWAIDASWAGRDIGATAAKKGTGGSDALLAAQSHWEALVFWSTLPL
jgi:hypothetical protein